MKFDLECTSTCDAKRIVDKYPFLKKYNINYYGSEEDISAEIDIELSDIIDILNSMGSSFSEIILGNWGNGHYYLEIYDTYRE